MKEDDQSKTVRGLLGQSRRPELGRRNIGFASLENANALSLERRKKHQMSNVKEMQPKSLKVQRLSSVPDPDCSGCPQGMQN